MKISPISFGSAHISMSESRNVSFGSENDYMPATVRKNTLADMEFNIIADTIRSQNLKNQMSARLMNLKRSLNNCIARDAYSS